MDEPISSSYEIIYVTNEHLEKIAQIHIDTLPDDFCSLLGYEFLNRIYYPTLIQVKDSFGLCAVKENEICGFVFFSKDPQLNKKVFFNNFFKIFSMSKSKFWKISFVSYVLSVSILIFFKKKHPIEEQGYELTYIAVADAHQKLGLGKKLVRCGLKVLYEANIETCWLKTLKKTPKNLDFYKKLGFNVYDRFLGRVYLYIKPTNN